MAVFVFPGLYSNKLIQLMQQMIKHNRFFFYFLFLCVIGAAQALAQVQPIPGSARDHASSIDYEIEVSIDPETRMLEGKSVITFNKTRDHI